MKIKSCSCQWCRALMHRRTGSSTMRIATRSARRVAKQQVDRMMRTREWDTEIPTVTSIPPIA